LVAVATKKKQKEFELNLGSKFKLELKLRFLILHKIWKHLQQGKRKKFHLAPELGNTCSREKKNLGSKRGPKLEFEFLLGC
jgi:hypothetical protein